MVPTLAGPVLRRVAGTETLLLRGGVLLGHWCPTRPVADIDFLSLAGFDVEATRAELAALLAREVGDGVRFGALTAEAIWAETRFPGVRLQAAAEVAGVGAQAVQIDVGFGDPVLAPVWLQLGDARVLTCPPESLLAWKIHGLFERGPGRWRPKDLHDACLLLRHAPIDHGRLGPALLTAFTHRGDPVALLGRRIRGEIGHSPWSAQKWQRYVDTWPGGAAEVGTRRDLMSELGAALAALQLELGP